MGADKALLKVGETTLLARAVGILAKHLPEVFVSVASDQAQAADRAGYQLIADRFEDKGPAAGLLSAHLQQPDTAWLVVACDMPLVDATLIADLVNSRDSASDATAWLSDAGKQPEPLCAIYEPATLANFLSEVQGGGNPSPRDWLMAANTCLLPLDRPGLLDSANTREEFESLTERLGRQS